MATNISRIQTNPIFEGPKEQWETSLEEWAKKDGIKVAKKAATQIIREWFANFLETGDSQAILNLNDLELRDISWTIFPPELEILQHKNRTIYVQWEKAIKAFMEEKPLPSKPVPPMYPALAKVFKEFEEEEKARKTKPAPTLAMSRNWKLADIKEALQASDFNPGLKVKIETVCAKFLAGDKYLNLSCLGINSIDGLPFPPVEMLFLNQNRINSIRIDGSNNLLGVKTLILDYNRVGKENLKMLARANQMTIITEQFRIDENGNEHPFSRTTPYLEVVGLFPSSEWRSEQN